MGTSIDHFSELYVFHNQKRSVLLDRVLPSNRPLYFELFEIERKFWISLFMVIFLMTIGVGQTVLSGSNIPYDVDFSSEVTVLAEGNCTGQSYTFGESGGVWVINNAEGIPANCDPSCTSAGGMNDNEFETVEFDISCLTDVSIDIGWNYYGDLENPNGCPVGGLGCGEDGLALYYNLDGAGSVLIEDVETCGSNNGISSVGSLTGTTLRVNVIGGTQAVSEFIEIENITINAAIITGNEDCVDAFEIMDGSNAGLDNFCDAVDGVVWYFYESTGDGAVQIDMTTNGGEPMITDVLLACGDTPPVTLPAATFTQTCITAGTSIWIGVGDTDTPGDDAFDLEVTLISPPDDPADIDFTITEADGSDDFIVCAGDDFDFGVIHASDPLDGTWTYDWEQPDGTIIMDMATINVTNADPAMHEGLWVVTVTDANGCTGTDEQMITVGEIPVVNNTEIIACEIIPGGGLADFQLEDAEDGASPTNIGGVSVDDAGTNNVLYFATSADANDVSITASTISSLYNSGNTTIFVRVVDPVSGCFNVAEVILTVSEIIEPIVSSNLPVCPGEEVTFMETAVLGIDTDWTGDMGATFTDNGMTTVTSSDLTDGETITVTATDINNCVSTTSFVVVLDPAPDNNECSSAEETMGTASGTTSCTSGDGNFCPASGDHVVYYSYTVVGPGAVTVTIDVAVDQATDIAAEAWTDCLGTPYDASISCGTNLVLDCVAEGTILVIPVGSTDGGEGTFNLTVSEAPSGGPDNDLCDMATVITIDNPCEAVSVSGTTTGACPETFIGGCTQNVDPTVWFTFTTLANTSSAEFTNVVGELQITSECPAVTTIDACVVGAGNVVLDPDTQYWLTATVNGDEGDVSFDIALLEASANDVCSAAQEVTGGAASGTTACASEDATFCGGTDHVVYYAYTTIEENATIEITVVADGATAVIADAWIDCSGAQYDATVGCGTTINLSCVPLGTMLIIPVGSPTTEEGTFDLTIT